MTDGTTDRTWFVTGASRGLGLAFARGLLAHGDRVVATARRPDELRASLGDADGRALVVGLDVTNEQAAHRAVSAAVDAFERIDVVVNNAGYGLAGGVEEVSAAQARAQLDTNFFGALWVTQAALPHLRAQRSGHIIQISSIAGVMAAPNLGIYCASKWALEAMSEALATEVAHLGIKVTIIEPSGFRTDWAGDSMDRATPIADYDEVLAARRESLRAGSNAALAAGDPDRAVQVLLDLVAHPEPPLRLPLGNLALQIAAMTYQRRNEPLTPEWEALARSVEPPAE